MASHMKTTVDIAPVLLDEAKRRAREQGTTLRALVEDGLRRVLEDAPRSDEPYRYEPVTIPLENPPGYDLSDPADIKRLSRYRR